MIACLIFSKDRACQLDALLRSIERYASGVYDSIHVLWKATTPEYERGYRACMFDAEPDIQWHRETDFETQTALFLHGHDQIGFHTDDEIWYRKPPLRPDKVAVWSLRLGQNTRYCHPLGGEENESPLAGWDDSVMGFCWKENGRPLRGDFGYPLNLNSTIYYTADILPVLPRGFLNPTQLEAGLAANWPAFSVDTIYAPLHSCVVCIPANVVSESSNCPRGGVAAWQPEALNTAYLADQRIDLDAMDFSDVRGCHQEIGYVLR